MSTSTPAKKQRFISLRIKVLVAFTILFTVIFAATYYWFFVFSTERAENRIREDLMNTLVAAAAEIDGDEIVALYKEGTPRDDGFTDDPRYWENIEWLDTVHKIEPRAWLGTYIREEDNFYFVSDLWALYDPESAAQFQQWCDPNPEVCGAEAPFNEWTSIKALNSGEPILHPTIISDQWGTWLSGFAPLQNDEGETVAGIFVDFEADYVTEVQDAIRDNILLAFVITYGFFFIFIFIIATLGSRPILEFTDAAEAVGEGNYDQDFTSLTSTRFPDEISTLAGVLSIMIDKVSQREQNLKRRVEELRIEIDGVKRKQEVQKIVETDSFRDLRDKARAMRARRKSSPAAPIQQASEDAE
jgi:methyl-accepting chemotaxis protein